MNLVLTGMRGTGKTTIAKAMSASLGWPLIDLDNYIEKKHSKTIAQIVAENGWEDFRQKEHKAAKEIAQKKNCIMATGGGTMMFERNSELLKKNATVVLLICDVEIAQNRIRGDTKRPSLTQQISSIEEIEKIWEQRKSKYYQVADIIVDTGKLTVVECVKKIIIHMQSRD